jgi:hypothetical protein
LEENVKSRCPLLLILLPAVPVACGIGQTSGKPSDRSTTTHDLQGFSGIDVF